MTQSICWMTVIQGLFEMSRVIWFILIDFLKTFYYDEVCWNFKKKIEVFCGIFIPSFGWFTVGPLFSLHLSTNGQQKHRHWQTYYLRDDQYIHTSKFCAISITNQSPGLQKPSLIAYVQSLQWWQCANSSLIKKGRHEAGETRSTTSYCDKSNQNPAKTILMTFSWSERLYNIPF